jgi:hypothetical protein
LIDDCRLIVVVDIVGYILYIAIYIYWHMYILDLISRLV